MVASHYTMVGVHSTRKDCHKKVGAAGQRWEGALAIHLPQLFNRRVSYYNYGSGASYSPSTTLVTFHYGMGGTSNSPSTTIHLLEPITCRQTPPITYSLETTVVFCRMSTEQSVNLSLFSPSTVILQHSLLF